MAMFKDEPVRPADYARFAHETPSWYRDAKLGIFVHWGPYSVPAWAEPIGPLGTFDEQYWNTHNPYAEWYYNTIRIEGSPAQEHQKEFYGAAPYDDFLDAWKAERFDADAVLALVRETGARYFVPTTKHHDGVTLWDAPGTGTRNTVARGPHRDLIGEFRDAADRAGVRFGIYYSGGLDWGFSDLPPIMGPIGNALRPRDRAYADYAFDQVADLIERYRPEVLWGDIEWPDAGKIAGAKSLIELFDRFYGARPEGVVNDRWGETHWDYRTSEYQEGLGAESAGTWENTRGVGFSFGYNQCEDETASLSGRDAIIHFVDVVSRGGNLLLNIGLTAAGEVPEIQRRTLQTLGAWNRANEEAIFGSRPLDPKIGAPSDAPWVRWTRTASTAHAFVQAAIGQEVTLSTDASVLELPRAGGTGASVRIEDGAAVIRVEPSEIAGPRRIDIPLVG